MIKDVFATTAPDRKRHGIRKGKFAF
jgi:hypothetical protein